MFRPHGMPGLPIATTAAYLPTHPPHILPAGFGFPVPFWIIGPSACGSHLPCLDLPVVCLPSTVLTLLSCHACHALPMHYTSHLLLLCLPTTSCLPSLWEVAFYLPGFATCLSTCTLHLFLLFLPLPTTTWVSCPLRASSPPTPVRACLCAATTFYMPYLFATGSVYAVPDLLEGWNGVGGTEWVASPGLLTSSRVHRLSTATPWFLHLLAFSHACMPFLCLSSFTFCCYVCNISSSPAFMPYYTYTQQSGSLLCISSPGDAYRLYALLAACNSRLPFHTPCMLATTCTLLYCFDIHALFLL